MAAVEVMTPRAATVRMMRITDKQWTSAKVFIGKDKL
jgi:CRISPR/Cas system-associated protein endoribonuclease Cas2